MLYSSLHFCQIYRFYLQNSQWIKKNNQWISRKLSFKDPLPGFLLLYCCPKMHWYAGWAYFPNDLDLYPPNLRWVQFGPPEHRALKHRVVDTTSTRLRTALDVTRVRLQLNWELRGPQIYNTWFDLTINLLSAKHPWKELLWITRRFTCRCCTAFSY